MAKAPDSKAKAQSSGDKTIAANRRGRFEYEIEESLEAGLVLTGTEVKSARQGQVHLNEAYASLEPGPKLSPEVWLHGMHIAPYEQGNVFNVDPRRKRKLLLRREQINKLIGRVQQKGYTLVPLKLYFTHGKAKLEIGVGRGRKQHDKRQVIADREIRQELRNEG